MTRALVAAALAAALVTAGAGAASAQEVDVRIADRLEPSTVDVPAGGTVTWHNADAERHRVRSTTGPERFDSGNLEPSETWSHTFSSPGVYHYVDARDDENGAYWGSVTVAGGADAGGTDAGTEAGGTDPGGGPISMRDRTFTPATVTVEAGTTVTWTNDDDREHTVTADDGSFDSGTLPPGATFTQTFDREGNVGYFCALHGGMRGTVQVGAGQGDDGQGDSAAQAPATSDDTTTPTTPTTPTTSPTGEPGGEVDVQVADFAFEPDALEVQAGTTVTWRQGGEVPHTVTADDGTFDSGTLQSGETFSHTFDDPGTYRYVCELHPQMVAAVTVADAGEAEPPDPVAAGQADAEPRASPTGAGSDGGQAVAASSQTAPVAVPLAGLLLLLGLLLAAAVLLGAWRIERALRRLASPAAPRPARQPPART